MEWKNPDQLRLPLGAQLTRTSGQPRAGLAALITLIDSVALTLPLPVSAQSAAAIDPLRVVAKPARSADAPSLRQSRRVGHTKAPPPWPLLAILAIQAALSLRLIWSNTAFLDEATYLYAGHQEIHYLFMHGTLTVPGQNGYYQTYFSGAPVLYPILGAIADSIGGLAAARLLSLAFMLGATTLLYWTTARIYDRRAAAAAASLFAVLAPTQFLGAFATYDAMALFLDGPRDASRCQERRRGRRNHSRCSLRAWRWYLLMRPSMQ